MLTCSWQLMKTTNTCFSNLWPILLYHNTMITNDWPSNFQNGLILCKVFGHLSMNFPQLILNSVHNVVDLDCEIHFEYNGGNVLHSLKGQFHSLVPQFAEWKFIFNIKNWTPFFVYQFCYKGYIPVLNLSSIIFQILIMLLIL